MSDISQSDFATISRSPLLRTDVAIEGGGGGCPPGEECLPSGYIDPADCPGCPSCDCEGTYVPYCLGPENADDPDTVILALSPFAYYLMDGSGGVDATGNGHTAISSIGTVTYGVASLTSKVPALQATALTAGGSITFPPPVADLGAVATPWAACLLMQVDDYDSGAGGAPALGGGFPFFSWSGSSPPKMGHGLDATGHLTPWSDSNFSRLGNYTSSKEVIFSLGEPHVLVINATYSAGGIGTTQFWLDGVLLLTNMRSGEGTDGAVFTIGRIPGGGPYFGAIDMTFSNLATWDRELTNAEIAAISAALVDDAILATSWMP